ncbi:MAG: threonylcarbamoyl-AMP synthase [Candidatus Aureabacteria bacterium]|nr:threonylcarbamoyl-AMP synthase [Candidatus Auribacterota bacterium]
MKVFYLDAKNPDLATIDKAAKIVREGGLVAFPTETVYGIAVSAKKPETIQKLYELKKRAVDKPYSYHFGSLEQFFLFSGNINDKLKSFFNHFCPGPITVVYYDDIKKKKLGIRIPNHKTASLFLEKCDCPVFAPSANPSSKKSPTTSQEVISYFENKIDAVLDAGPCDFGKDSTVVETDGNKYKILRHGAVTEAKIKEFLDS